MTVLSDVSLSVRKGEFVSIMGPSGSGKSTMLQLMGCLDRPSVGKVFVDSVNAASLSSDELADLRASRIGFVFQAFNLLANLSAVQNIELAMAIGEREKAARRERARQLLKLVGLEERADHKPSELSGGEKQRVAIARALANEPSLLLMDEPTGNLDSKAGNDVMQLVASLWKGKGITVVLITHEEFIADYAERVIRLKDGRVESMQQRKKRGVS